MVELADDGAHAVVAQAAGMGGRGHEAAAQGVHLGGGADFAGVAEVIGELAAGQAGAAGRLHGNDVILRLAPQHLAHEGGDEAAQVGAAAGAADDHIGLDAVFIQRRLGLQTDDGLVEQHLVQHAAQHVAVALVADGVLHRLGDGAAQRAHRVGEPGQNVTADGGGGAGRGGDGSAVGAHHLTAEGLLLIAALHHEHVEIQAQIGAGHGQGRAPLAGAGLGGDATEPLLLGVIRLGDGAVQLMAAGGVVALELIVDFGGGVQLLLQAVGPHQRRGAVHLVEVTNLTGNLDIGGVVVQLLAGQLPAEHSGEVVLRHGGAGGGVQQRGWLYLHVGADVVPRLGQLLFRQVDFVGNGSHIACLLSDELI